MRICVCGAQVPFMRGGAELLMSGLVDALEAGGFEADVVQLPTTFRRAHLFEAAMAWRLVPVDADLVIATNFPSYFVRHPNKVVWLLHQHRAAYDWPPQPGSDFDLSDAALADQRRLAEWDRRALGEARRRFTLSRTVTDRLTRDLGLPSEPLYHPPPLAEHLHPGPTGDYVFAATRLEGNKRPDLLLAAMEHTGPEARLVVAGRGAMEAGLHEQIARSDLASRVELLGFVPDDELVELFAGARAVVYVPFDEDYGYVTLQAFLAAKPVVTTTDAGGVLEWVEDGSTGFITDGTPAGIGHAIDALTRDPALARTMGEAARARVADLSWGPVVERLTAA